jgi:hypothetical protein
MTIAKGARAQEGAKPVFKLYYIVKSGFLTTFWFFNVINPFLINFLGVIGLF